jgi:hypothetical protein
MYNYLTKTYAESSGDAFKSIQTVQKVISDIESMADSNYRLARCLKKNRDHGIELPEELCKNVNRMFDLIEQALGIMNKNVESHSGDVAQTMKMVYELEQEIDTLRNEYRSKYLFNVDKIELQKARERLLNETKFNCSSVDKFIRNQLGERKSIAASQMTIEGIEDVIMVFLAGLYSQNKMVSYTITYNSKTFNWQGKVITDYIVERKQ